MITPELLAKIRRLFFAEHWKAGTIAAELGLHRETVLRALDARGFLQPAHRARTELLDPHREFLRATLEQHPRLRATRLFEMLAARGYRGSVYPVVGSQTPS